MRNFITVFNFEFKQFINKKSTLITLGIYVLLAFGITFIPNIIAGNNPIAKFFSSEDNSNFQRSAYIVKDLDFDKTVLKEAKEYTDRAKLEGDLKSETIDEAIILDGETYEYIKKSQSLSGATSSNFVQIFDRLLAKNSYAQNQIDYDKVEAINLTLPSPKLVSLEGDAEKLAFGLIASYFLSFIVYFTVILFGTVAATNVAKEKANRAMELLVVTVKPLVLITGKVFAVVAVAFLQVILIMGAMLLGLAVNKSSYVDMYKSLFDNIDYSIFLVWLLFAITAVIMFMFLFSAFASLVSKLEEVNTVITLPMMIVIAGFLANFYAMGGEIGKFTDFLAYFPLTSYFSMFTRYAQGGASLGQVAISYGLLLVTTIIIALICVKVYRRATLSYGKKLNFFKLLLGK
ncbi:ABC transporter permease [Gemella sp. 19428wG2_WT2a]|nr:ABC transporter permease [Gemella sp. 19428wG2_WT2a]TFU58834.1 ABC transporter permease [Gemella sp. WT2a]